MTRPRLDPQRQKTASSLYVRALSFLMSARELGRIQMETATAQGTSDTAHNREHSASFYLLLGFATELLLKVGYLVHGGKKPITDFGHDLQKVLAATEALGWIPQQPKLRWLIDAQQTAHKKFYHRYDTAPEKQLVPDIKEAVQVLWDLAHQIQAEYPAIWDD